MFAQFRWPIRQLKEKEPFLIDHKELIAFCRYINASELSEV